VFLYESFEDLCEDQIDFKNYHMTSEDLDYSHMDGLMVILALVHHPLTFSFVFHRRKKITQGWKMHKLLHLVQYF